MTLYRARVYIVLCFITVCYCVIKIEFFFDSSTFICIESNISYLWITGIFSDNNLRSFKKL